MKKYFLHTDNGQEGPLTLEEMQAKNLKHDTPVWTNELEDWTHAGKIEELRSFTTTTNAPYFKETNHAVAMERPLPNSVGGLPIKKANAKWLLVFVIAGMLILLGMLLYNRVV